MIARIGFDELDPALREVLRPRVERLGYLGELFQCAAHQPEALVSLNALTEQLADRRGELSERVEDEEAVTRPPRWVRPH